MLWFRGRLAPAVPAALIVLLVSGCGTVATPPVSAPPATAIIVSSTAAATMVSPPASATATSQPADATMVSPHAAVASQPATPAPAHTGQTPSDTPAVRSPSATPALAPAPTHDPTPTAVAVGPVALLDGVAFPVELALTPEEQRQGLSDRPALAPGTGMLFVYEVERSQTFWMKDMLFPLDMVWIGDGCTVAQITHDVPAPAPGTKNSDLPRYSPDNGARYVLEINAGEAQAIGLAPGAKVSFKGTIFGEYGC